MRTLPDGPLLAERYDALFLDLDGVVYRGDEVVALVRETLEQVRERGARVLFLTNNSSRTAEQVAGKLAGLGVVAARDEVLTSGLATAAMLRRRGEDGKTAFVIGERGIRAALEGVGIRILDGEPERSDLVVVGWDRSVDYARLRTASLLVQRGARLVATNADASYPAPDGLWPGAGAILAAVTTTTGATPTVVGKPGRPLFEAALEVTGAERPLVVGDRLDTDIRGAIAMGFDSLLVFSGANRPADLVRSDDLPTYVARDLSVLLGDPPAGRFRPARAEDAGPLRDLLRSSGLSDQELDGDRLGSTLLCYDGGAGDGGGESMLGALPVAAACLEDIGGYGLLRSVAVRADARAHGLGMLAVASATRSARARGISHVSLFTESAGPFFDRLGFSYVDREGLPEPVRTSHHAAEECAVTASPMVLTLRW